MSKDNSIVLIRELVQTHDVIGPEKTAAALIDARSNDKNLEERIKELIISEVCLKFSISRKKLLFGKTKDKRTDALMVMFVLAQKHLEFSLMEIGVWLRKDKSNISKAITAFNRLDKENKKQASLLDKHGKINDQIKEFIIKQKVAWPENP